MMNPKTLEALIVDHSFGELSPEAMELLDAYLEANPDMQKVAIHIKETLSVTERAVTNRPDLFGEPSLNMDLETPPENVLSFPTATRMRMTKAVAALAILFLVGIGSYYTGTQSTTSDPSIPEPNSSVLLSSTSPSPWAQYRMTPGGIESTIPTSKSD